MRNQGNESKTHKKNQEIYMEMQRHGVTDPSKVVHLYLQYDMHVNSWLFPCFFALQWESTRMVEVNNISKV